VCKAHKLVHHSTLGSRVIKEKKKFLQAASGPKMAGCSPCFFTLVTGPRRSVSLQLSDTRVYEPHIRAGCSPARDGSAMCPLASISPVLSLGRKPRRQSPIRPDHRFSGRIAPTGPSGRSPLAGVPGPGTDRLSVRRVRSLSHSSLVLASLELSGIQAYEP